MQLATFTRAVVLPVSVPLGEQPDGAPWTWQAFNVAMNGAFRLSTELANWCVRRLFVLDDPTSAKCPDAVKKWYGYKDAGAHYPGRANWSGAMQSFQCVIRAVQRKYVQQRFDAIVRNDSSLLTYRYPQPFPVHNAAWSPSYADGGFPVVSIAVPGVGRVELRLKRGAEFGRQLAQFRYLHDHPEARGEAALYRDRKGNMLLKMVGSFPKVERTGAVNVAFVHTDPAALLVVEINGRRANVTNGDHIRRVIAMHKTFLARAGQDKKREVRMDRRQRANLNKVVDERCGKQHDRLKTAVYQVASQVARMCQRQHVGTVAYDDSIQTFVPDGFPWHALKTRVNQILAGEMGCEWIDGAGAGGPYCHDDSEDGAKERREWLARARASLSAVKKVSAHKSRPRGKSHRAVSRTPAT